MNCKFLPENPKVFVKNADIHYVTKLSFCYINSEK